MGTLAVSRQHESTHIKFHNVTDFLYEYKTYAFYPAI
jgi:hypothetical protein